MPDQKNNILSKEIIFYQKIITLEKNSFLFNDFFQPIKKLIIIISKKINLNLKNEIISKSWNIFNFNYINIF